MPRISVSNLDLYRMWRDSEELDLEWLLRRLRGEEPQTEAMKAGLALHEALEHAEPQYAAKLISGEYKFYFRCEGELAMPQFGELSFEKDYGPLTVRGRVDWLKGRTVKDYKTTASFDADRYLEGYQWRYYLDMTDADTFEWIVFVMDELRGTHKEYEIFQIHELRQHRYEGLHEDCMKLAGEFLEFARGLEANGTDWRRAAVFSSPVEGPGSERAEIPV